ncbi:MAG: hypothetical protein KDB03_12320 [Planctomycetales bacterium]|nr:hypothetical protein [Planctomycetales bacterium]
MLDVMLQLALTAKLVQLSMVISNSFLLRKYEPTVSDLSKTQFDNALKLIQEHFNGVTDKDGQPYVTHCLRVMHQVQGLECQLVALMHDLIEDTSVTIEDLHEIGFEASVITAIDLMTHRDEDSYCEYVVALKTNPLARQVKMADLSDNASLNRVLLRQESWHADTRRVQKYIVSYQFLTDRISEVQYRELMQELE